MHEMTLLIISAAQKQDVLLCTANEAKGQSPQAQGKEEERLRQKKTGIL